MSAWEMEGSIVAGGGSGKSNCFYILHNSVKVSLQNLFLFQEVSTCLVSLGGLGKW